MLKQKELICKTCELSCELHVVFIGGHTIKHDGLIECRLKAEPAQKEETYWCAEGRWKSPRGFGYLISYENYRNLLAEEEGENNE